MRTLRAPRVLVLLVVALVGLPGGLALPQGAAACVWTPAHFFSPLPPCPSDDATGAVAIRDASQHLLGKILSGVAKIQMVKREIKGWQAAYETAQKYKQKLYEYWGQATANPLPAMVAEYNRNSPLARYVRVSSVDGYVLALHPLDIAEVADSVWSRVNNEVGLQRFYQMRDSIGKSFAHEKQFTMDRAADNLRELTDHEAYVQITVDSLRTTAQSLATRYTDATDPKGLAEAKIARMSAVLNQLQGTAFEAQSRAITARLDAFAASVEERDRERRRFIRSWVHPF